MAGVVFSKGSGVNDSIFGKSQEPIRAIIEQNVEAFEKGRSQIDNIFVVEKTCLLYTSPPIDTSPDQGLDEIIRMLEEWDG